MPMLPQQYERKYSEPLDPKEIMSGAVRNSAEVAGLVNTANQAEYGPNKEYDWETQLQEAQIKEDELQARISAARTQNQIIRASNRATRVWNKDTRQWENQLNRAYDQVGNRGGYSNVQLGQQYQSIKNPTPELIAFFQAIAGQESGGEANPYAARGAMTPYGRAMGKYQILPTNIGTGSWDEQILGRSISNAQFMKNPRLQDAIALGMLQRFYNQSGAKGAASEWFSGDPNRYKTSSSVANYVDEVMGRYHTILPGVQRRFSRSVRQDEPQNPFGKPSNGNWLMPTKGQGNLQFGSEGDYGPRNTGQGFHTGIDINENGIHQGTPVYAAQDGVISTRNYHTGYGNQIFINHGNKLQSRYQHLATFATGLKQGQRVKRGQLIGYVGNTGTYSGGVHLHFEVRKKMRNLSGIDSRRIDNGWVAVNPMGWY